MNVVREVKVTHMFLEWYESGNMGVAFVEECWVERKL